MKLLLDQHLSHKLVARIADLFADTDHVRNLGMAAVDDEVIWQHARANGFTIVSKDGDFHQMSLLRGAPPKIVWLRVGNASTAEIAAFVRSRHDVINAFVNGEGALLVLDP